MKLSSSFDSFSDEEDSPPVDKTDLARRIGQLLGTGGRGGLPLFLSGGGAVTLLGGPRAIKDLDFRVDLDPARTFREDDILSDGLIDGINRLLEETFHDVVPLTRADPTTGMTIAGMVDGVEVSITRTPAVSYMSWGSGPSGVPQMGEFDLLLDKAYSLTMRRKGDFEKKVTDLIDILSLIEKQPGLVFVFRGLGQLRGGAYGGQIAMAARRGGAGYDADLLREFCGALEDLGGDRNTKRIMTQLKAERLYPLLSKLLKTLDTYIDKPAVHII